MAEKKNRCLISLSVMLIAFSFAVAEKIHPGLKNAIDNGDYKMAKNLVEKVGVKDIYCPSGLSFDDAVEIYGDDFEKRSSRIWERCETGFIENVEKEACKRNVGLCKEILKRHDESEWTPFVEQIVKNKLNRKKRKLKVKKEVPVKVSKKECRANYREAELFLEAFKEELLKTSCNPKDEYSFLLCSTVKMEIDSLDLSFKKLKDLCEKKSMVLKAVEVEENVVANSFWYEAEKFGLYITLKIGNVFDTSKVDLSLYDKFAEGFPDTSSSNIFWAINEIFKNNKEIVMSNLGLACHVFPNIKHYFNESNYNSILQKGMYSSISVEENQYVEAFDKWLNFASRSGFNSHFFDCSKFAYANSLGAQKKDIMKIIVSNYAKQGFVDYWKVSFCCKRFPGLEKELKQQTGVEMYNCNILKDFEKINRICTENDTTFVWNYFYSAASAHYPFVCDNRNWRTFTQEESVTGKLCEKDNQGEFIGEYVCENSMWRRPSNYESSTKKLCRDENRGEFIGEFVCDTNWRRPTLIEKETRELCYEPNYRITKQVYEKDQYYCDKTTKSWIRMPSKAKYGFVQDQRDGKEYKTVIVGRQEWIRDNLDYDAIGSRYSGRKHDSKPRLYEWNAAQNACPTGYRLPTKQDWKTLIDFTKHVTSKGKVRTSSENVERVGYIQRKIERKSDHGELYEFDRGELGEFDFDISPLPNEKYTKLWLSESKNASQAYYAYIYTESIGIEILSSGKENAYPIRCIKKGASDR